MSAKEWSEWQWAYSFMALRIGYCYVECVEQNAWIHFVWRARVMLICLTSVVANFPEGPPIWNGLRPRKWKFASGCHARQTWPYTPFTQKLQNLCRFRYNCLKEPLERISYWGNGVNKLFFKSSIVKKWHWLICLDQCFLKDGGARLPKEHQ